MIWPDGFALAVMAMKFALYLGVLGAAGTVMAALMFRLDCIRALAGGFAIVGAGGALFDFSLRGGNLAGDVSGMIDPEMLGLLWSTSVGTAVLLAALLGLGALNKLHFVPALRIGDPAAATHLRNSIRIEGLLILAFLGVSAMLTSNLALLL